MQASACGSRDLDPHFAARATTLQRGSGARACISPTQPQIYRLDVMAGRRSEAEMSAVGLNLIRVTRIGTAGRSIHLQK
jgi:hypothetical protein